MSYIPSTEVFTGGHRAALYPYTRPSDQEFRRRHEQIRAFLEREGLDALLIAGGTGTWDRNWTNTRWAVGHVGSQLTNYTYVVFPRQGEPTVLAFPLNAELPARRAREVVEDVRAAPNGAVGAVQRLKELGLERGAIGLVETDLWTSIPRAHHDLFTRELPEARFRVVTNEWWRQVRLIRSAEEIGFLERAALIGDAMHRGVVERIEAGMPERAVFAALSDAMIMAGGEIPTMILAASGPTFEPFDTYQRERAMDRVLGPGDVILTEIAPRYPDGSECQTGRSFVLGAMAERYEALGAVMLEAYRRVVDQLRPGKTDQDVFQAAQVITDHGYTWLSPLVSGAEGGASGSQPMVAPPPNSGVDLESWTFEPNMVLVIEIHVETPDHAAGLFIADTWVTTQGDPRCLNRFPREIVYL